MPNHAPHSPDEALDHWLVARAQSGDEGAMERLYARWAERLQRHALRLTRDADGASDASQEAWLAIVRGVDRLDDPACFRRWAYQIVGRKCVDWVRRRQHRRATTETLLEDPPAGAKATDDDEAERQDSLRQTLRRLPNRDRVILALHYDDALPLAEIAESLGVPLGTVKSRLYHARQRLKQALQSTEPTLKEPSR